MRIITQEETAQILKEDPRYAADAYLFVGEALEFTTKKLKKPATGLSRHVSGGELLEGIRIFALQEYGPMSKTILNAWGVHDCRDIGYIVFNMVNKQILGKTEEDSLADFNNGFDFETAFRTPFKPEKKCRMQNEK